MAISAKSLAPAAQHAGMTALAASPAWATLDPLLSAIYEGPPESPPWQSALKLMRDLLGAAHVTLILRPPSPEGTGVMINTGETSVEATKSYETHFFALGIL